MLSPKDDVISGLYEAALGERSWDEVGRNLMGAVSGHTLLLMTHQPLFELHEIVNTQGLPDETMQTYAHHYAAHDVWVRGMDAKKLVDRPVVGAQLIDDGAFERTEFYYDFVRPRVPVFHVTCGLLTLGEGRRAILGIHRPRDAGAYSSDEVARMGQLIRHVRSSLFLRGRMQRNNMVVTSALAALNRLTVGVVLLGPAGRVLHANAAAEAVLQARDGIALRDSRVHVANSDEDRRLQRLIAGVLYPNVISKDSPGAGGRMRIGRPSGRLAYAVAVTPAGRNLAVSSAANATALLFVSDPMRRPQNNPAALEAQFGFTPAEARLVHGLMAGQALPVYARNAGITHNTARTQLARALARTGTNSQLELLRLVYTAELGIDGEY